MKLFIAIGFTLILLLSGCDTTEGKLQEMNKRVDFYIFACKQNYRIAKDYYEKATSLDTTVDGWYDVMEKYADSAKFYNSLAMDYNKRARNANDSMKYLNDSR